MPGQEDCYKFKASLDYTGRLCVMNKTKEYTFQKGAIIVCSFALENCSPLDRQACVCAAHFSV